MTMVSVCRGVFLRYREDGNTPTPEESRTFMLLLNEARPVIKQLPGHVVVMVYLNEVQISNTLMPPLASSYSGVPSEANTVRHDPDQLSHDLAAHSQLQLIFPRANNAFQLTFSITNNALFQICLGQ
jgi:hypothetical protein